MARPPGKVLRSSRFASRRRDVRRARQRRRRRVTITFLALGILALGGWMLARSSLFALERIEVAGTKTLSRSDIIGASGLRPGASMLSLDLGAVEARIARLPLIRSVEVSKPEASRIRIVVTERTPAFVLETIHGFWSLDAEAVVLGPSPNIDPAMPTIRALSAETGEAGEVVASAEVRNALALWGLVPEVLRSGSPVVEVRSGGLTLMRPGLTIRFGPYERIDQKIEAVRLLMERAHASKEHLSAIDVRSPVRPAAVAAS